MTIMQGRPILWGQGIASDHVIGAEHWVEPDFQPPVFDLLALDSLFAAYDASATPMTSAYLDGDTVTELNPHSIGPVLTNIGTPIYQAAGIGGRPSVFYDRPGTLGGATNTWGTDYPWANDTEQTIYAVCSPQTPTGGTSNLTVVSLWDTGTLASQFFNIGVGITGAVSYQFRAGGTIYTITTPASYFAPLIIAARIKGGQMELWANGTKFGPVACPGALAAGNTGAQFRIGALTGNLGNTVIGAFAGQIGGVWVYRAGHSDANVSTAMQRLSTKYGISLA